MAKERIFGGALAWATMVAVSLVDYPMHGASLILNEYNGVGSTRYLDNDNYSSAGAPVDKEDAYFASLTVLGGDGRVQGNGGNWFELVITGDHVDMRGWKLQWAETDKFENNGNVIWYTPPAGPAPNQGILTLSSAEAWSDLRAGTILTFSELAGFRIDTTLLGNNRNFSDFADPISSDGVYEVAVDLSTDLGFNPGTGDWSIHVSTRGELASATPLVTTVYNTTSPLGVFDPAGSFSTGNDGWELTLVDAGGAVVFGPAGEVPWVAGLNSREVAKLEGNPSTAITADDVLYNDGASSTFGLPNVWNDLATAEKTQDFSALRSWYSPSEPSADFDGDDDVDGADFISWQRGVGIASGALPADGDADGNGAVNSLDLAIWKVGFGPPDGETPLASAVPEPSAQSLIFLVIAAAICHRAPVGQFLRNRRSRVRTKSAKSQ